jgi:hypothetical protein
MVLTLAAVGKDHSTEASSLISNSCEHRAPNSRGLQNYSICINSREFLIQKIYKALLHVIQTGPGVKWPEREADN